MAKSEMFREAERIARAIVGARGRWVYAAEPDDVVQDILLEVVKLNAREELDLARLPGLVRSIARAKLADYARRQRRERELEEDEGPAQLELGQPRRWMGPEDMLADGIAESEWNDLLSELRANEAAALDLWRDGKSAREIADALGVKPATAAALVRRAQDRVKRLMVERGMMPKWWED